MATILVNNEPCMQSNPENIVEVFATNVQKKPEAGRIVRFFAENFPELRVNFDLSDCDKIFRIAGKAIDADKVAALFNNWGHHCKRLQ